MSDSKEILIFLVDDNPLYLRLLEFEFRENPVLKIKTFLSGEACIENLFLKPDVIILDYILTTENKKAMDGLQALIIIKNALPDTQVIMLSAMESIEVATNSLKLGASDYIVKNQDTFTRLKAGIKRYLGMYSKEKELIVWDW
jgi:DNA-binding NtrC family response regulator